jgi:hypothetical protein
MTVFGKILVFVNLVFSLLVAGLIIMAYVARTNYADAFKRQETELKASRGSAEQYKADYVKAVQDLDAKERELKASQAALGDRIKELDIAKAKLEQDVSDKNTNLKMDATNATITRQEIERLTDQAKALQARVDKDAERLDEAAKLVNDFRKRTMDAEIKAKALGERNAQLAQALEEMEKEMVRRKAAPGGTTVTANVPNPPPGNVEGLVKTMDASSGLVTITIGSDAGIAKGHTLQVFRLKPTGKYVGEILIRDVRAHEAVGKFTSKPLTPVQVGDTVASKIS